MGNQVIKEELSLMDIIKILWKKVKLILTYTKKTCQITG